MYVSFVEFDIIIITFLLHYIAVNSSAVLPSKQKPIVADSTLSDNAADVLQSKLAKSQSLNSVESAWLLSKFLNVVKADPGLFEAVEKLIDLLVGFFY